MEYADVKKWLETRLNSKQGVRCSVVSLAAKQAGITRGQMKQARMDLKVKTINQLDRSGKTSGEHIWVLR